MADIFLSYSREDRAAVTPLGEALAAAGYSVWWDRQLAGGTRYLDETTKELNAAKAVLVVWSKTSIASHWVADEAGVGRDTGRLLPISLDGSLPPLGFRQFQVIDFSKWTHDRDVAFKDLLVALARLARLAPPSSEKAGNEKTERPARKQAAAGGGGAVLRRPVVLGGIALAVVAALAIAAFTLMRPQAPTPDGAMSQRTAFFGFSVDGNDPTATAIAKSATSETFATLSALALDTASASETQNVERSAQLARARELGARYALGGEVRRDGDKFSVTIRLDDVQVRATLLQETLTGGEEQKVSLPFRAAARATNAVGCYIVNRTGLRNETDEILRALLRACAVFSGSYKEGADRRRELARLAPDSTGVQTDRALWLFIALSHVPATEHPAMREEIDEALRRVMAADPTHILARTIQADLSIADGRSLAEAEKLFLGIRDTDPSFFFLNMRYGLFLVAVGRNQEALRYLRTGERLNPLNSGMRLTLAHTLARVGLTKDAEEKFLLNDVRVPDDGGNWRTWIQSALFDGAGDPRDVLARAPPDMSGETFTCMKEIVEGWLSSDAKVRAAAADRVIACEKQGSLLTFQAIRPAAAFGRIDDAFAFARKSIDRKAYTLVNAWPLFASTLQSMRNTPRFLDFMKELGIYQYWLDTGTHPDVCDLPEEKTILLCATLRADQAK